jgi:prepilin-type N-terminal cleavage/methylation domain-containing protein
MKKFQFGFSLIEIMVVVSLIGILSAVGYANFSQGSAQSRDAQRQADLRIVSTALELYKNKYGQYPQGCNSPGTWSGHAPAYDCSSGNQYIVGLAPEFIPRLPQDPRISGDNSGYVYTTNADGTVYIFKVRLTVETENVDYGHPFQSCDTNNTNSSVPLCNTVYPSNNKPTHCQRNNSIFNTSYAIWAGFAVPDVVVTDSFYDVGVERLTEDIVCEIP